MKQQIKKYIGELLTIIGTGLFTYNVFNFSYEDTRSDMGSDILAKYGIASQGTEMGIVYYYAPGTLLLVAIGAMLIVSGILIIKAKFKLIFKELK